MLNRAFYDRNARSFSDTRKRAWPGWGRCLEAVDGFLPTRGARVLDLACGNMRFERFLAEHGRAVGMRVLAVDCCDELAGGLAGSSDGERAAKHVVGFAAGPAVEYLHLDVADALLSGVDLACAIGEGPFDFAVCFGFAHHVPGAENRRRLLAGLCRCLSDGGVAALSFWRFAEDAEMRRRAEETTAAACAELGLPPLGAGDYILGWNGVPGAWRYCHSFSDDEVDGLADSIPEGLRVIDRFAADGRTGSLNVYLVLQKSDESQSEK